VKPWHRLRFALFLSLGLLPVDVLVSYVRARVPESVPGEYGLFGPAGAALLRGDFSQVLSNPGTQAGPFELAPYGVAHLLRVHGTIGWTVFYVVLIFLVCVAFFTIALLPLSRLDGRLVLYGSIGVALFAILGSVLSTAVLLGHPADVLIPALWVAAGVFARRDRAVLCALLIGLSVGFEVWGILGAPIILLAPAPRLVRSAIAAVVVVVVLYAPLLIAGHFATFAFKWMVSRSTLWGVAFPGLADFPWPLRVVQAALAVAVGLVVTLLLRDRVAVIWLVPFAIIAVRLLLDPLLLDYYWVSAAAVGLLAVLAGVARREWMLAVSGLIVAVAAQFAPSLPLATAILYVAIAIAATIVLRVRRLGLRADAGLA